MRNSIRIISQVEERFVCRISTFDFAWKNCFGKTYYVLWKNGWMKNAEYEYGDSEYCWKHEWINIKRSFLSLVYIQNRVTFQRLHKIEKLFLLSYILSGQGFLEEKFPKIVRLKFSSDEASNRIRYTDYEDFDIWSKISLTFFVRLLP